MNRGTRICMLTIFCVLSVAPAAPPASATQDTQLSATDAQNTTTQVVDQNCIDALTRAIAQGINGLSIDVCSATHTTQVSESRTATLSDVQAERNAMSASEFRSLYAAVAAGGVRTKTFNRTYDNVIVAWAQSGRVYFDGSTAWVSNPYRGFNGYQTCKIDRSIGYVIEVKKCDESGSASQRNLRAVFHSSAIPSGGGLSTGTRSGTPI